MGKPDVAYCTILASNYLPKALALAESLRRHEGAVLTVFLIDVADDADVPHQDGVHLVSTRKLGLADREVLDLATIYGLVEFATAVKPRLLARLLEDTEVAVYLDPDTWLTAPLDDLWPELDASSGGVLLTPHMLHQPPPDATFDVHHALTHGVYNLGFCAVDRRSGDFLQWWWDRLRTDCLYEPTAGLFVDQKWVDVGAVFYDARALRHPGYNVGIGNLAERTLVRDGDRIIVEQTGDPLRLFHFHAFDARHPEVLSTRFARTREHELAPGSVLRQLTDEYAEVVLRNEAALGDAPSYPYFTDTTGEPIRRRHRRAFREELMAGTAPPSPFVPEDAKAYAAWRRSARPAMARTFAGEAAHSARWLMAEEFERFRKRYPKLAGRVTRQIVADGGM